MDRKVVMVKDIQCLESIANIAAFVFMETDYYISLGMAVETYITNPSANNFKIMHDIFQTCMKRYPKFNNARQQQVIRLIQNGNLQKIDDDKEELEILQLEKVIEDLKEMEKIPDNVIQLFPTKPVDKK